MTFVEQTAAMTPTVQTVKTYATIAKVLFYCSAALTALLTAGMGINIAMSVPGGVMQIIPALIIFFIMTIVHFYASAMAKAVAIMFEKFEAQREP